MADDHEVIEIDDDDYQEHQPDGVYAPFGALVYYAPLGSPPHTPLQSPEYTPVSPFDEYDDWSIDWQYFWSRYPHNDEQPPSTRPTPLKLYPAWSPVPVFDTVE